MSEKHLTQQELILLLDGEGDPDRQRHLTACAFCRSRRAELEETLAAFGQVRRDCMQEYLPSITEPRAKLLAKLEALTAAKHINWWYPAYLAAACLLFFAIYHRPPDLSIPKNSLTPGETRNVSLGDVCRGTNRNSDRMVPVSLRQQVFREYGINDKRPNAYEVDYLITPELGGADSLRNLWPEPYSAVWNAHVKDELEERLHGLVCSGQIDLATAQREISQDWIGAYKKYFHTNVPGLALIEPRP
jgi:hypothetical protein